MAFSLTISCLILSMVWNRGGRSGRRGSVGGGEGVREETWLQLSRLYAALGEKVR